MVEPTWGKKKTHTNKSQRRAPILHRWLGLVSINLSSLSVAYFMREQHLKIHHGSSSGDYHSGGKALPLARTLATGHPR